MENLTLEETPPPGGPMGGGQMPLLGPGLPPPQNQQLPPQMFTTAAQLLDMTDSKLSLVLTRRVPWRTRLDRDVSLQVSRAGTQKPKMKHRVSTEGFVADDQTLVEKLMVTLRDGRKLIGVLRSWDQFGMCCPQPCAELLAQPILTFFIIQRT